MGVHGSQNFLRTRGRRITYASLAAALMVFGLSGCRSYGLDDVTAVELSKPEVRHPIHFSKQKEELLVEMPERGRNLSRGQHADVWRFIESYKSESNGRLVISSPSSARGHFASTPAIRHVLSLTREAGIPEEAIRLKKHYTEKGDIGPAIGMSYARSVAVAPGCGRWPKDIGNRNRERMPFENFGCATQRNLALNVANARDLQFPQDKAPRSSEVRSKTWGEYIGVDEGPAPAPATSSGGGAGLTR